MLPFVYSNNRGVFITSLCCVFGGGVWGGLEVARSAAFIVSLCCFSCTGSGIVVIHSSCQFGILCTLEVEQSWCIQIIVLLLCVYWNSLISGLDVQSFHLVIVSLCPPLSEQPKQLRCAPYSPFHPVTVFYCLCPDSLNSLDVQSIHTVTVLLSVSRQPEQSGCAEYSHCHCPIVCVRTA